MYLEHASMPHGHRNPPRRKRNVEGEWLPNHDPEEADDYETDDADEDDTEADTDFDDVDWNEWEKNEVVIKKTAIHKSLMQTASKMKNKGYEVKENRCGDKFLGATVTATPLL